MAPKTYLLAVSALFLLNSCAPSSPSSSSASPASSDSRQPEQHTHTVEITQMKFIPAELTVHAGDTVVFANYDLVTHDITEAANKEWTSSLLPADKQWSFVVTKSADYYCSLHPTMKGKIIVK